MSTLTILSGIVTALSPVLVVVITWWLNRRINARAAADKSMVDRLQQQREDFNSVMDPLRKQVDALSTREAALAVKVEALEDRLDQAEDDQRYLVYDLRRSRSYYQDTYQDPGPTLTNRTVAIIERVTND